jgi:hypothetical protein
MRNHRMTPVVRADSYPLAEEHMRLAPAARICFAIVPIRTLSLLFFMFSYTLSTEVYRLYSTAQN